MSSKHQIILIQVMCFIKHNVTVNVNYNPILDGRSRSCRICTGVRMLMTLIIKHIVTYAWPRLGISLPHQISIIVLIIFHHKQGNVTVNVTYPPKLASRPRSRRLGLWVRLYVTLIARHTVTYAWPQFEVSYTHLINLNALMCFFSHTRKWDGMRRHCSPWRLWCFIMVKIL